MELPREQWSSYFDAVTHALEDADLSIQVTHSQWDPGWEAEHLALQFLAYDAPDGLFEIAAELRKSGITEVVHHLVEGPRKVVVDAAGPRHPGPHLIAVEGANGESTVIRFESAPGSPE